MRSNVREQKLKIKGHWRMIKKCELKEITLKTDIQQKWWDKGMEITLIKKNALIIQFLILLGSEKWLKRDLNLTVNFKKRQQYRVNGPHSVF